VRVVFDTNVLISALVWPRGVPAQVVALARQGRVHSVTSPVLLEELRWVLQGKLGFQEDPVEAMIEVIIAHSEVVVPRHALHAVQTDPEDNRVLECALEGRADAIVTGDHHLLELGTFREIPLLTPREFLSLVSPSP